MRIARVIGTVTLNRRLPGFPAGRLLIGEALDGAALAALPRHAPRAAPSPESLVMFDQLGAGAGTLVGVSEGREAAMPFDPQRVPCDAYCAMIIDTIA